MHPLSASATEDMAELSNGTALMVARIRAMKGQVAKFGIVGVVTTATHVLVLSGLVELAEMEPILANTVAFLVSFAISFVGHFLWTFGGTDSGRMRRWHAALPRFLIVAVLGFLLNSLIVFSIVNVMSLSYRYAIVLIVTVVPVCTFVLSRYWAFTHSASQDIQ